MTYFTIRLILPGPSVETGCDSIQSKCIKRLIINRLNNFHTAVVGLTWINVLQCTNDSNTHMRHEWKKLGAPTAPQAFARGLLRTESDPIRPPWSWKEEDFVATCTRCDACAKACPGGIIVRGSDGFPEIDFTHGACTFCGDCVSACEPGALVRAHQGSTPWLLKATITQDCRAMHQVACFTCGDSCAKGAIRFQASDGGTAVPEIDRRLCKGCGACLAMCSASAIKMSAASQAAKRAIPA